MELGWGGLWEVPGSSSNGDKNLAIKKCFDAQLMQDRYLDQSGTLGCKLSNQGGMLFQSLKYGVNVKHQEYFADSPSSGMDPASRDE
ncbi:hypothetical protein CK203_027409 [Vitis vinifera]|uniref:Uncharacterized protein n=1 Tax=Vitis vinifera TaxID=29760 RepID=A0A438J9Q8_VITVI|nr:hypothetical protein CK203_027409 [Vitis vinifera]